MYEEDRNRALEMYNEIFDEVNNETAVLQLLVSPTRQAVNLARAYDARERKYQSDDGEEPAYQLVIEDLRRQAGTLMPEEPKVNDGQISLFNDDGAADNVFDSLGLEILPQSHDESTVPAEPEQMEFSLFPDEDRAGEPAPLSPPPAASDEQNTEKAPGQDVDDFSDAVEAFLADFTLTDELAEKKEQEEAKKPLDALEDEDASQQPQPVRAPEKLAAVHQMDTAAQHQMVSGQPLPRQDMPAASGRPEMHSQTPVVQGLPDMTGTAERRVSVPLLILFILPAVAAGLVCVGLLLALAIVTLGMASIFTCVGISGMVAAFGFSVFADILLVFGLALAAAAIGLLLLWTFIWFLAGAIPGVIRGIVGLGRKLCYKEVSA